MNGNVHWLKLTKPTGPQRTHTHLLDLVFLHEGHELEQEPRQAEQEVNEFMDDERPPGGNLEFGVVF